ncbi:UNVERIFIED_CONTAM: hypothetical protein PYX00_006821 [Menopon gallinae]|uniref:CHCH domain-containing protein n=1 Tax=Menopon gallinae TaxID=328185 RepID=A0AAW2HWI5_9NEOP
MGLKDFRHGQPMKKADDEEDPLEKLMKGTGCLELHYEVQSCIFETQDWRKCQKQVEDFKKCMEKHKKKMEASE